MNKKQMCLKDRPSGNLSICRSRSLRAVIHPKGKMNQIARVQFLPRTLKTNREGFPQNPVQAETQKLLITVLLITIGRGTREKVSYIVSDQFRFYGTILRSQAYETPQKAKTHNPKVTLPVCHFHHAKTFHEPTKQYV